jgi:hypothetical protein
MLPDGISTTLKPAYEPIMLARAPLAQGSVAANVAAHGTGGLNITATRPTRPSGEGYWPSHILLSHQPDCALDACATGCVVPWLDDVGGREPLSRLFYASKAHRAEREAGLGRLPQSRRPVFGNGDTLSRARANIHPTVKPLGAMRWLVRLITPPGGLVLDPFAGSGSTGCGAVLEGRRFLGIERDARYLPIAKARLAHWVAAAQREIEPTPDAP